MNTTTLQNTLNARLAALVDLPDVAWPNVPYEPTNGTEYLRPTLLPANNDPATLSWTETMTGVYQVDVFMPSAIRGPAAALTRAEEIAEHFRASDIDGLSIRSITVGQALPDGAFYRVPVSIVYRAYVKR